MIWFSIIGLIIQIIVNWPKLIEGIGAIIDAIKKRPVQEHRGLLKRLKAELETAIEEQKAAPKTMSLGKKAPKPGANLDVFLKEIQTRK